MRRWTIEETLEGHWTLFVDGRWPGGASVEGDAEEWLAIADAIRGGVLRVSFKRCGVYPDPDGFVFWSPRNSVGDRDSQRLTREEALALEASIRATLPLTDARRREAQAEGWRLDLVRFSGGMRLLGRNLAVAGALCEAFESGGRVWNDRHWDGSYTWHPGCGRAWSRPS